MKNTVYVLAALMLLFLGACSSKSTNTKIHGEWVLQKKILANGEEQKWGGDVKELNFIMLIKADGTYTVTFSSVVTPGKWTLSADDKTLTLKTDSGNSEDEVYQVEELTDKTLRFKADQEVLYYTKN